MEEFTNSLNNVTINNMGLDESDGYMITPIKDFTYHVESNGIVIDNYIGNDRDIVVIPPVIDGKTVISLNEKAFFNYSEVREVFAYDGLINIGKSCFQNCTHLHFVTLPDSVTTIGDQAFAHTGLECFKMPKKIEKLSQGTFYACKYLRAIDLNEGLKSIGTACFYQNKNLKTLVLPNSLTKICPHAFSYSGLEKVEIPPSVKHLDDNAFYICRELAEVTLHEGLESIGDECFYQCYALLLLDLPSSLTKIGENALPLQYKPLV